MMGDDEYCPHCGKPERQSWFAYTLILFGMIALGAMIQRWFI